MDLRGHFEARERGGKGRKEGREKKSRKNGRDGRNPPASLPPPDINFWLGR